MRKSSHFYCYNNCASRGPNAINYDVANRDYWMLSSRTNSVFYVQVTHEGLLASYRGRISGYGCADNVHSISKLDYRANRCGHATKNIVSVAFLCP